MDRSKRRSHARVPASVKVTMLAADGRTTTVEQLSNISLGGVFVHMTDPLPFGEELSLEFELPSGGRVIRCRGLVVWSSRGNGPKARVGKNKIDPARLEAAKREAGGRQGIGVRLMEIGIADMRALADYIERSLKS